jgi:hypothetical protein
MKRVALLVVLCSATLVVGQEFRLRAGDGTLSSPVLLKDGVVVTIGGVHYTVTNAVSPEKRLQARMERIEIPEIQFREAPISEVIEFLLTESQLRDPDKVGINILLDPSSMRGTNDVADPFAAAAGGAALTDPAGIPKVTLSARYITMAEALKIVGSICGLKPRVRGNVVCLVPFDYPESEIVRRAYDVLPSVEEKLTRMDQVFPGGASHTQGRACFCHAGCTNRAAAVAEQGSDWKTVFAAMGVSWPLGSSIRYIGALGKLLVANTLENHEKLRRILITLCVIPHQVEVELHFVSFDAACVAALAPSGINVESLTTLWTNGHGQLLAAPRIITQVGQEATVTGVAEYIYPTDFETSVPLGTNSDAAVVGAVVEPCNFETREVGSLLSVLPDVSPGGDMLNLTLTPEYVWEPEWHDYGGRYVDSNGKEQKAHMPQPFFTVFSISTSVALANGARVLLAGGTPTRDGKRLVFAFLSAGLVDIRGEKLRSDLNDVLMLEGAAEK